ncbi:MAG: IS5/IS1182 family transposase, partial [Gemmobacter sp.]|nr:IS5/IS1182 family transposase [Gemmobacter sp.]
MGVLDRVLLSDGQWNRISGHIIGDERTRGS